MLGESLLGGQGGDHEDPSYLFDPTNETAGAFASAQILYDALHGRYNNATGAIILLFVIWGSFFVGGLSITTSATRVDCRKHSLFDCGSKKRAVIATLSVLSQGTEEGSEDGQKDEIIAKALEGLPIQSASDLQKVLRINTYTSQASAFHRLKAMLPVFQSRMGAMLFLISALLS